MMLIADGLPPDMSTAMFRSVIQDTLKIKHVMLEESEKRGPCGEKTLTIGCASAMDQQVILHGLDGATFGVYRIRVKPFVDDSRPSQANRQPLYAMQPEAPGLRPIWMQNPHMQPGPMFNFAPGAHSGTGNFGAPQQQTNFQGQYQQPTGFPNQNIDFSGVFSQTQMQPMPFQPMNAPEFGQISHRRSRSPIRRSPVGKRSLMHSPDRGLIRRRSPSQGNSPSRRRWENPEDQEYGGGDDREPNWEPWNRGPERFRPNRRSPGLRSRDGRSRSPRFRPERSRSPRFRSERSPRFGAERSRSPRFEPVRSSKFASGPIQGDVFDIEPNPRFRPEPKRASRFEPEPKKTTRFDPEPKRSPRFDPEPKRSPRFEPKPNRDPKFVPDSTRSTQFHPEPNRSRPEPNKYAGPEVNPPWKKSTKPIETNRPKDSFQPNISGPSAPSKRPFLLDGPSSNSGPPPKKPFQTGSGPPKFQPPGSKSAPSMQPSPARKELHPAWHVIANIKGPVTRLKKKTALIKEKPFAFEEKAPVVFVRKEYDHVPRQTNLTNPGQFKPMPKFLMTSAIEEINTNLSPQYKGLLHNMPTLLIREMFHGMMESTAGVRERYEKFYSSLRNILIRRTLKILSYNPESQKEAIDIYHRIYDKLDRQNDLRGAILQVTNEHELFAFAKLKADTVWTCTVPIPHEQELYRQRCEQRTELYRATEYICNLVIKPLDIENELKLPQNLHVYDYFWLSIYNRLIGYIKSGLASKNPSDIIDMSKLCNAYLTMYNDANHTELIKTGIESYNRLWAPQEYTGIFAYVQVPNTKPMLYRKGVVAIPSKKEKAARTQFCTTSSLFMAIVVLDSTIRENDEEKALEKLPAEEKKIVHHLRDQIFPRFSAMMLYVSERIPLNKSREFYRTKYSLQYDLELVQEAIKVYDSKNPGDIYKGKYSKCDKIIPVAAEIMTRNSIDPYASAHREISIEDMKFYQKLKRTMIERLKAMGVEEKSKGNEIITLTQLKKMYEDKYGMDQKSLIMKLIEEYNKEKPNTLYSGLWFERENITPPYELVVPESIRKDYVASKLTHEIYESLKSNVSNHTLTGRLSVCGQLKIIIRKRLEPLTCENCTTEGLIKQYRNIHKEEDDKCLVMTIRGQVYEGIFFDLPYVLGSLNEARTQESLQPRSTLLVETMEFISKSLSKHRPNKSSDIVKHVEWYKYLTIARKRLQVLIDQQKDPLNLNPQSMYRAYRAKYSVLGDNYMIDITRDSIVKKYGSDPELAERELKRLKSLHADLDGSKDTLEEGKTDLGKEASKDDVTKEKQINNNDETDLNDKNNEKTQVNSDGKDNCQKTHGDDEKSKIIVITDDESEKTQNNDTENDDGGKKTPKDAKTMKNDVNNSKNDDGGKKTPKDEKTIKNDVNNSKNDDANFDEALDTFSKELDDICDFDPENDMDDLDNVDLNELEDY